MERDAIDGVARDALVKVAMRVGNLERRLFDLRTIIAGLFVWLTTLAVALALIWVR